MGTTMSDETQIEITGLSRRDRANLLEHLPKELVAFKAAPLKPGELGDPTMMIAVIALSGVSITGMLAWLATQGVTVKASIKGKAFGQEGSFDMELNPKMTAQQVTSELAQKGVDVK
jgi:hypothetical protein